MKDTAKSIKDAKGNQDNLSHLNDFRMGAAMLGLDQKTNSSIISKDLLYNSYDYNNTTDSRCPIQTMNKEKAID